MAYTAPKTYSVGDVLTAADMNTYQRDNISDLNTRVNYREVISINTALGGVDDAGSTVETTIYSTTVPADYLGSGNVIGVMRVTGRAFGAVTTVVCTLRVKYGGTTVGAAALSIPTTASDYAFEFIGKVAGDGGPSAQRGWGTVFGAFTGGNSSTAAVTSSDAQTFLLSSQMGTSGSTSVNVQFDVSEFYFLRGP